MRKKQPSNMTPAQFNYVVGLLNKNYTQASKLINRSPSTTSQYVNGYKPIPLEVVRLLKEAVDERKAKLAQAGWLTQGSQLATDAQLMDANHRIRMERAVEGPALPLLARRLRKDPDDLKLYPSYRMSGEKFKAYLTALNAWAAHIRTAMRQTTKAQLIKAYTLELYDLKALAEYARGAIQKGAPYDVCITRGEWYVVSRALRHLFRTERIDVAFALYQHWRTHKGFGYPI